MKRNNKCPRCGGLVSRHDYIFRQEANKCHACGAFHERGSIRMSIERQITRKEPSRFKLEDDKCEE